MSVQRQVLFRSQHLHDILGLLAYNPSENGGGGTSGQNQKQVTTKKPEPHVVNHTGNIGSKTGQIHLDGVKEGGNEEEEKSVDDGEGRGVRDDTSRASDVGSFCSTSNEGETRLLPIPIHVHSYPVYQ